MRATWRGMYLAACALGLLAAASSFADDDDQGRDKGKGSKGAKGQGGVVQVDLSQLPPDLAKELRKYLGKADKGRKGPGKGKAPATEAKRKGPGRLPPGLAKKPADHPGRIAWLKAHGSSEAAAPKGKKGK